MNSTEEAVRCVLAFTGALVVTLACTPLLRRVALRYDVVDHPGDRKTHPKPTPYLGGVGLVAAVLVGVAFAPAMSGRTVAVVAGGLGVALIGLLDDKHTLSPAPRVAVQTVAAVIAAGAGLRMDVSGNEAVDVVVTVLWIVGITNAFNLLDNMDGLSAGASAVAGMGVFAFAVHYDQYLVSTAAAGLVGGCFGFLVYNKRPASIFMGDAGALTLGFAMAILAIGIQPNDPTNAAVSWTVPVLLLWLPILDTSFVVVSRLRNRRPVLLGARDHLSHRLVDRGLSQGQAVLTLLGFYTAVVSITVARMWKLVPPVTDGAIALLLAAVVLRLALAGVRASATASAAAVQ